MRLFKTRGAPPRALEGAYAPLAAAGLCLAAGLVLAFAAELVGTQSWGQAAAFLVSCSPRELATALFLALATAFFAGLTRSVFLGGLLVAVPAFCLALVNFYKTLITSTPLYLADLALIGRVGQIAELNRGSLRLTGPVAGGALLVLALLAGLFLLRRRVRAGWGRSLLLALCAAALFLPLFCLPAAASAWFYGPVGAGLGEAMGQTEANAACGPILGLWRTLTFPPAEALEPPATVDEETQALLDALALMDAAAQPEARETQPHVIFILSESFFDMTALPGVAFEADPIPGYRRACAEGVWGRFYTHTLGYGTMNIELELMTGINSRFFAQDEMISYWTAEKLTTTPALPALFREAGYYTAYLHTFNDSIYGRREVYPGLGFDEMFFSGDFAAIDPEAPETEAAYWAYMATKLSGMAYGDDYLADLVIDLFEREREAQPVFLWAVTMENHTPFTPDKYDSYSHPFTSPLEGEAAGVLAATTEAAANSAAALEKLLDYFSGVDEPVVLIFFGDHKPGLPLTGTTDTVYSELGLCAPLASDWDLGTRAEMYAADYAIWANDESLLPAAAGTRRDTASTLLGLDALYAAGLPLDEYWRCCAAMAGTYTAWNWNYFIAADGAVCERPDDALDAAGLRRLELMAMLMRNTFAGGDGPGFYELAAALAERQEEEAATGAS